MNIVEKSNKIKTEKISLGFSNLEVIENLNESSFDWNVLDKSKIKEK